MKPEPYVTSFSEMFTTMALAFATTKGRRHRRENLAAPTHASGMTADDQTSRKSPEDEQRIREAMEAAIERRRLKQRGTI